MIRRHYYFGGMVQGVGFRYRCLSIAESLKLSGWVRKMYDGRVEAEIQGEEASLDEFLYQIHHQPWISITDIQIENRSVVKNEKGFRVVYRVQ